MSYYHVVDLPHVWHKPVDPASTEDFSTKNPPPVTQKDIGGTYLTTGLRSIAVADGKIDMAAFRRDLDLWHNAELEVGESNSDKSAFNFGRALWPNAAFLRADNWNEAMEELRKRGLAVVDVWGIIPGLKRGSDGGISWLIDDNIQARILETLGSSFLGWDNGEEDGRWYWHHLRVSPAPVSRVAAYENFVGWFKTLSADLQGYMNALCGITYPHYLAAMDSNRMIGAELLQALPSINIWCAWIRGASRQYQKLWLAGISVWDMFGYKTFDREMYAGDSATRPELGLGNPQNQTGPDKGQTLHMMRRAWLVAFMYGVNIEAFETSQFTEERRISPLGKMQLEVTKFCVKNAERRGVQYCPLAIMTDFHSGWTPPRHYYSDSFYTVWGCMPYEKGDHQMDMVFRNLYPGYQDCAYYRDGRGFLTATPCGDIADVVLSDIDPDILDRYQAVLYVGESEIDNDLLKKLIRYVDFGGIVVWSIAQLGPEALELAGISLTGRMFSSRASKEPESETVYNEFPYSFAEADPKDLHVLLDDGDSRPLMCLKNHGRGRIYTITVPYGMTNRIPEKHPIVGGDPLRDTGTLSYIDKPIGTPYRLLEGIKRVLNNRLKALNIIEVEAYIDPIGSEPAPRTTSIQYITNVTNSPDKLVVTLANHNPFPVYVRMKAATADIGHAIDLLHDEVEMKVVGGYINLTLFPCDSVDFSMYIIQIVMNRPVYRFMEEL